VPSNLMGSENRKESRPGGGKEKKPIVEIKWGDQRLHPNGLRGDSKGDLSSSCNATGWTRIKW